MLCYSRLFFRSRVKAVWREVTDEAFFSLLKIEEEGGEGARGCTYDKMSVRVCNFGDNDVKYLRSGKY